MRTLNCTTDYYDQIYARWLENPGTLLDLAEYTSDQSLLDLCGGSGAVAIEALRRGGRRVSLLDLNPRVRHPWSERIDLYTGKAEEADRIIEGTFDLIVCRQAIGYLDIAKAFKAVNNLLRPGGKFAFNTFTEPRFAFKSYYSNCTRFVEISIPLWTHVLHVQRAKGFGTDVSLFRFHTEPDIDQALNQSTIFSEWSKVEVIHAGRSLRWVCRKEGLEGV